MPLLKRRDRDLLYNDKKFIKYIDMKSDECLYKEAVDFIDKQGTLTNTQMSSLENITNSSQDSRTIVKFIEHQKTKALNKNHREEGEFWEALKSTVNALKKEIKAWLKEGEFEGDKKETAGAEFLLLREFIQHLTAEHRFSKPGGR